MRQNRLLNNAVWLMAGKAGRMAVNLVVNLLTARYLGPEGYGLLHYAAAYTGFFASFCSLGIDGILVKELTDAPDKEGEILGTALYLRGISSLLSAAAILCLVFLTDRGDPAVLAVTGCAALGMFFQIFEVFPYWFQFRQASRVTALTTLGASLVSAGCKVLWLLQKKTVVWFAFSAAAEQICAGILLLGAYQFHAGAPLHISRERGRALLKKSCHFILPGLMVAVYAQTDKLMLKALLGQAQTGYYSTAVSLCGVWCFVLNAIIDAWYPEITRAGNCGEGLFLRRNRQLYAIVFYISAAVSLVLCLRAEPLVLLLYGKAYLPAAAPLRILTWYTGFSYLGVARNAWMVCKGRQKYLLRVYAMAAAANVVLNYLLIPRWGTCGAAAASLAAQVVTTLVAPFLVAPLRENGMMMVQALMLRGLWEKKGEKCI